MANSDSDDWIKTEEKSNDFDGGLGDDWESAFQAEEFMFSPEEEGEDGFFHETNGPSTAYEFTPPKEGDLAGLPDLDQESTRGTENAPGEPQQDEADKPHAGMALSRYWQLLREKLFALPLVQRLALGSVTLLLPLLALILFWPSGHQPAIEADLSPVALPVSQTDAGRGPRPENIRRKWPFEPFILPVTAATPAEKPSFLEVDLVLVLVLPPNHELPTDKKLFVRDLIYSYYRQQPLATLRRFALARGEMNRNLLAWLREHWPEAPVETVLFTRYQLT